MGGPGELRGATATSIAFVGAFLGVFLIPVAVWYASPLLGSAGFFCAIMVSLVFITLVLLLAIIGLSGELEEIRQAMAQTSGPHTPAAPAEEKPKTP